MFRMFRPHHLSHRPFGRRFIVPGALAATAVLGGCGYAGAGHHGGWHAHHASPEARAEFMRKRTHWALDYVKATDAQKAQIDSILNELQPEMAKFADEHKALRADAAKLLAADAIDPQEAARVKAAGLQLAERAANTWTEAIVKAANVLTPEQRKQLIDLWNKWN
jgi:periplasmic protein CpxP/Spy